MSAGDILDIIHLTVYGAFLFVLWALTRPVYVDMRRRRSGFGIVFDSHTGNPVSMAVIRLKNAQGVAVNTVVSDGQGRYRLVAPKGDYTIEVSRPGYKFPSVYLGKSTASTFHDHVLASVKLKIQDYGTITRNIPVDPTRAAQRPSWLLTRINLGKRIQYLVGFLGTGSAIYIAALQRASWVPWVMLAVYLLAMLTRLITFKAPQPPFGVVFDSGNKRPLAKAIVRLFDKRYDKLIETQTTSPQGRFAFIVKHGAYRLMVEKDGYRKVIINYPAIQQDGFLLARNVAMNACEKQACAIPLTQTLCPRPDGQEAACPIPQTSIKSA